MARVLILMATYNGEKYLAQQLDSILAQSIQDWHLLVRDDGSTDGTVALLEEYRARDSRIRILENKGSERGASVNFHELIRIAKASDEVYPYYAFGDQDDIWLVNKLEHYLEGMREQERLSPGKPILLYGNFSVVDANGRVIEESHGDTVDMRLHSDWDLLIALGRVWGCASLFNRALLDIVQASATLDTHVVMHDNYLATYAKLYGVCFYAPEPLIMHRVHENNVSVIAAMESVRRTFFKLFRLKNAHRGIAVVFSHALGVLEDLRVHDPDDIRFPKLEALIKRGGIPVALFCLREGVKRVRWDKTLALYCLLLLGGYRKYLTGQYGKVKE